MINIGCANCNELWIVIKKRRDSPLPINESDLTFCNKCLIYNERLLDSII
jgi:hypothetical protein